MKLLLEPTLWGNFSSDFLSCSSCFIFKSFMTRSSSWERVIVLSPTFSLSPSSSLLLFSSPPFRLMSSKSRPKNASYKHTIPTEWPFMLYISDGSELWSDLNIFDNQQDNKQWEELFLSKFFTVNKCHLSFAFFSVNN